MKIKAVCMLHLAAEEQFRAQRLLNAQGFVRMFWNTGIWTLWTALLLQLCWAVAREVKIDQCVNDGLVEVAAGHKTSLTCTAEGDIQWRLHWISTQSHTLATCTQSNCNMSLSAPISDIFEASVTKAHIKTITINAENNTKIQDNIQLVNGSLECILINKTYSNGSANCTLNYVYPPENVSCEGVETSLSVNVSCTIGSVYSSRRIYKCHLRLVRNKNESLETGTMMTSPTSNKITESEMKMSGSCYFNTRLPPGEGNHSLFVSVSPGGRSYPVIVRTNTTLIPAESDTGAVLSINSKHESQTVRETDQVHFRCQSNETHRPQMTLCKDGVVFQRNQSINHTIAARCEDSASYTCSTKNNCSSQSTVTTLVSLSLDVQCKPRNISSRHLEVSNLPTKPIELTFEVIANPVPRDWGVWLTRSTMNSSEAANDNLKPMTNVTCKADVQSRYLSRCMLTVSYIPTEIPTGSLKVQIINEVGDENFTVEIKHVDDPSGSPTNMAAVTGGVIGVILFIAAVVIIVVIKRGKNRKAPLTIRGLGDGWCRTSASTRSSDTEVNKDRWTNQDGLTYVSLRFDNRKQFPAPKHEATEYSRIKFIPPDGRNC